MATNLTDIDSFSSLILGGLSVGFLYLSAIYLKKDRSGRRAAPYPPGPKGYPIIRNLLDIPDVYPWVGYAKMSKQFGDMIFLRVFSKSILILNSPKTIWDLIDKKSSLYSGRPHSTMVNDLMCLTGFPLLSYGAEWRKQRRMFHRHYNPTVSPEYRPMIKRHVRRFLVQILETPTEFAQHTHHLFGGIIMHMGYGYEPLLRNDPYITEALEAIEGYKVAGVRGRFLVDNIPFLKYIPAWVPGAGFRRWAEYYRVKNVDARRRPFEFVLEMMKRNEAEPCVVTKMVEGLPSPDDPSYAEEEDRAINVVGVSYLAGTDTTTSMANAFILAMAQYPECHRKVREELDRVVGAEVLPDFNHREDLLYLNATLTETLRWYQVTPLALPHTTTEDDHYDGYFIPKGTIVFGNAWAVLHDPEIFDNPMEFRPERYIKDGKFNSDLPDPSDYAFGFGRRICPGRHIALEMLYLMAASTMAMFDILSPVDGAGNGVEIKPIIYDGIIASLGQFDCIIRPHSVATERLVRALLD